MYRFVIIVLAVAAVSADWPPKSDCETADDCGTGQCCVAMSRFYILSKRRVLDPMSMKGGVCTDFIKKDDSCHMLGFAACGCEPGTKCVYYPAKLELPMIAQLIEKTPEKRMMANRPGDSFCRTRDD